MSLLHLATNAPQATSGATDPYYANVVLLQNMNGNGNDAKGHTVTTYGSPTYGADGLVCNSAGTNYLQLADSADWDMGAGDWTMDMVGKLTSYAGGSSSMLSRTGPGGGLAWRNRVIDNGSAITGAEFVWWTNTFSYNLYDNSNTSGLALNTQFHMRIVTDSVANTSRMYLNGALFIDITADTAMADFASPVRIGSDYYYGWGFPGTIRAIRITKGVARDGTEIITLPFPEA
jgi:hypothetical protein